jgi:ribosomal protein S18 acetylase RimI-like enzyme
MNIRIATEKDKPLIWSIIEPVFRAGDTYAIDSNIGRGAAIDYWFGPDKTTFVLEQDGDILGTYYIRTNQAGGGSHVCNCGYITAAHASGRGIARKMCEHSLEYAKSKGYLAMQFNFVVSSNVRAVALWKSIGFNTIGILPRAFNHPALGYMDALVMFKALD